MTDNRLNDIETMLAHQEQQMRDMSDMIAAQWKEIEALKRRLDKTQGQIDDLQTAAPPVSQKPPHY